MQRDTESKNNSSALMFTLRLGPQVAAQPLCWMLSPEMAPPASPPSAWGRGDGAICIRESAGPT